MPKLDRVALGIFLLATFVAASREARADGLTCTGNCGFVDNNGAFTSMRSPAAGVNYTLPSGINDAGTIVGNTSSDPRTGTFSSFLYNGTTYTTINYPGSFLTQVGEINDLGEVVGYQCSSTGPFSGGCGGFTYSTGTYTPIVIAGGNSIDPRGIDNAGQIVGSYSTSTGEAGFLDSGGTITSLIDPGASSTLLTGINDNGQIVGYGQFGGVNQGFVYQNGSFTTLSFLPSGVNDSGEIVGTTSGSQGEQGVIDQRGTLTQFSVPGSTFTSANGISNAGEIVGDYNGPLLSGGGGGTPMPEPGTLVLLATSLVVFAVIGYRRRRLLNL